MYFGNPASERTTVKKAQGFLILTLLSTNELNVESRSRLGMPTFYSILFYSILVDYQSLYGHGKEDESGLSSWYLRIMCYM